MQLPFALPFAWPVPVRVSPGRLQVQNGQRAEFVRALITCMELSI
jgi:hypothetical protein